MNMKLAVSLLLLAALSRGAHVGTKNKKTEEITDKRELTEGNSGFEKRAPIIPTASPALSGGIEYADSNNALPDKSPTQQFYATPAPQFSKVSDLLSGQAPSYQAAIASHLYSPVSIYQSRFGQPTTYEVSAPVPSNLAYTEHRLSMPSANAIQYIAKSQKLAKPNYVQPQVLVQQSYEQNLAPAQQVTASPFNQQVQYNQIPQQLQYAQPSQLQATTYRQEYLQARNLQQPEQRDLKNQPALSQVLEKQVIQQVYNDKQQNALSYARFSVNQPTPSHEQNQLQQVHQQALPQAQLQSQQYQLPQQYQQYQQYQQPQQPQQLIQPQQYQPQQQQQYQLQAQPLQISYQLQHPTQQLSQVQQKKLQPQLQYQVQQPQIQYQEQPQYLYQQLQDQALQQQSLSITQQTQGQPQYLIQPTNQLYQQPQLFNVEEKSEPIVSKQSIPERQNYYKQSPIVQPSLNQPQVQSLGHQGIPAALPTFPPVQYFGKFAHSLFGDYQH